MRVAIVHYWLITRRGGEKVLENLLQIFPNADIYTLFYDPSTCGSYIKGQKVYSSVLNIPILRKHHQKVFPLYPLGIRSLKLREDYDLIISSESGPAKGISKPKDTPHICYIHTPMRYCWGFTGEYLRTIPGWLRPIANYFFKRLRKWDLTTVSNVDLYIANSRNVAERVKRYYNRDAEVVYPPIAEDLFKKPLALSAGKDIYLSFGALVPYKRVDLLVDSFRGTDRKLVVIGDGPERAKLQKAATNNVQFTGLLDWKTIEGYFAHTKALLFPGEEDFGMIPLEVMAYGIPVLAFKKGGALETVLEEKETTKSTGMFFDCQDVNSVQSTLIRFEKVEEQFDPMFIREHARKFKEDRFRSEIKEHIERLMKHLS
jgi:glycosyltransferase involved in cell wall biosynthesis